MRSPVAALSLAVPLMFGLAACGDDGTDNTTDDAATSETAEPEATEAEGERADADPMPIAGDTVEVRAQDNEFIEPHIQVEAGATVVWTNEGRQDHDVIPTSEALGAGEWGAPVEDFVPGDAYEHTFDEPGVYPYYCTLHGTEDVGMIGTVVVE